ncbi:MAG: MFS transporter [Thermoguttaceae bacterium]
MSRNTVGRVHFAFGLVVRSAVVAGLGGFLLGFDTVVISGTNETLERVFNLNVVWAGFTVAIAPIGTILGTLIVGRPSDALGRKKVLFALAIGYFVSALGCGFAQTWYELLGARFLGGVAIGGASVVTPMYIAEISPPRLRGRLVMVNQFNIVVGVLLSFVSNYLTALTSCARRTTSSRANGRLSWPLPTKRNAVLILCTSPPSFGPFRIGLKS